MRHDGQGGQGEAGDGHSHREDNTDPANGSASPGRRRLPPTGGRSGRGRTLGRRLGQVLIFLLALLLVVYGWLEAFALITDGRSDRGTILVASVMAVVAVGLLRCPGVAVRVLFPVARPAVREARTFDSRGIARLVRVVIADRAGADLVDVEKAIKDWWTPAGITVNEIEAALGGDQPIDQATLVAAVKTLHPSPAAQTDTAASRRWRAAHEAGHTAAILATPGAVLYGATIEGVGDSGGITAYDGPVGQTPDRAWVLARLTIGVAGVEAERILLGQVMAMGGTDDMYKAIAEARELALNDGRPDTYRDLLSEARQRATDLIASHRQAVEAMAEHLEKHTYLGRLTAHRMMTATGQF